MIFKILLLAFLVFLGVLVARQKQAPRGLRGAMLTLLVAGAYFVLRPEDANAVARFLGVGRGADLLMYVWVVITFSVILLLYLRMVEMQRMLTELARRVALIQPMEPSRDPTVQQS